MTWLDPFRGSIAAIASGPRPVRVPPRFFALVGVAGFVAIFAGGCAGGGEAGGSLAALVAAEAYAVGAGDGAAEALRFPESPRLEDLNLDHERRPAVLLPEGTWSWRAKVPDGGWLQVGIGVGEEGPIEATVSLRQGEEREVLEVAGAEAGSGWLDFGVDLGRFAGREVVLELDARRPAGGGEGPVPWAPVSLAAPRRPGADEKPNILFILVDTLRYDHLTAYGYERETSPEIQRLLADAGTVMEDAYSQAPWTLPSVVSYMTGRFPGEILGDDRAAYGIPDGVGSVVESLAALGYRTGGFFANPALHAGNGFGRGFETFYTPESMEAFDQHADDVNRRAIPWLQAHQGGPFFLYVHYIDPHDPYMNPDVVGGRSPWFDDPGGISGRWMHGVYTGQIPVRDLEREVEHFTALYDTEIRYVDRAIGELIESIPEEVLADTLVVFTADHGEELQDHGGWKHGHTLYEEQIHVPLIFRWDGRIPAGRRIPGTVRLVDLTPTLLAAAGGEAPASWQGVSLLPALTGEEPLPRLPAFAQNLQVGPLRAASIVGGKKLILFNEREPFTPLNALQEHVGALDLERLERIELYDLDSDPGERENLLPAGASNGAAPAATSALEPVLYRHLDRTFPGVRVFPDAVPAGSRLAGELEFEVAPGAVVPLFLGPDDTVELEGTRLRFELAGDRVQKGFRVLGETGALTGASLALDGQALPAGRLRYGAGLPFTGRTIPAADLAARAFPAPGELPGLRVWTYSGRTWVESEANEETRKSLEALGYVQ